LQPGEEKVVSFTIEPKDLMYFDENLHDWKADPGKFKAYIGSSSTDIRSTLSFVLQ